MCFKNYLWYLHIFCSDNESRILSMIGNSFRTKKENVSFLDENNKCIQDLILKSVIFLRIYIFKDLK